MWSLSPIRSWRVCDAGLKRYLGLGLPAAKVQMVKVVRYRAYRVAGSSVSINRW